jgi:Phage capsid protein
MAVLTTNQGLYPDFTAQYSSNIEMLLQQMDSRLRPHVSEKGGLVGKMASPVTQYGSVTMKAPKGRFSPLDHQQPNSIRPWLFPMPGELPQLIDSFDELQTIVDPKSAYTQAAAAATGRFWDDGIIASAFATRQIGTDIGSLSPDSFSTTNFQVSSTFGSSSASGLTVAKLIEAQRILRHYHNDLRSDPPTIVIGSQQASDLLNQVQFVSTEFNDKPVLKNGEVESFMGFNFAISERLSVSANVRNTICFVRSGMQLGMWKDMNNRIDIRYDLSGTPWQLLTSTMYGSVRMQAGKVVSILCSDSTGSDITP